MADPTARQSQIQAQDNQDVEIPVVLSRFDLSLINARARFELMQIIFAQAVLAVIVSVVSWLVGGFDAGWSALAGSAAYFVPNFLLALRLFISTFRPQGANPAVFLVGELLKVFAAISLLWLFSYLGEGRVVWAAMIVGLIAVLKGYLLVLMFGDRFTPRQTNT